MFSFELNETYPHGIITNELVKQKCNKRFDDIHIVRLEEGITKIDNQSFVGCGNLEEVFLPDSLEYIEFKSFAYCKKLRNIYFGPNMKRIDDRAFEFCDLLEEIDFSNCPDCIFGQGVFNCCFSLSDIILPNNLEEINANLFYGCENLERIEIPEGVCIIRNGAFEYCSKLESIYIPDSVYQIGCNAFNSCEELYEIRLSKNLNRICENAFENCESLREVYVNEKKNNMVILPESLEIIDENAFYACSNILKLYISKGIRFIFSYAFSFCSSLMIVIFDNNIIDLDYENNIFSNSFSLEYVLLAESINNMDIFRSNEIPRYTFSSIDRRENNNCNDYILERLEDRNIIDKFRTKEQLFLERLNPKIRHPLSYHVILSYMPEYNNEFDDIEVLRMREYSRYHRIVRDILEFI